MQCYIHPPPPPCQCTFSLFLFHPCLWHCVKIRRHPLREAAAPQQPVLQLTLAGSPFTLTLPYVDLSCGTVTLSLLTPALTLTLTFTLTLTLTLNPPQPSPIRCHHSSTQSHSLLAGSERRQGWERQAGRQLH